VDGRIRLKGGNHRLAKLDQSSNGMHTNGKGKASVIAKKKSVATKRVIEEPVTVRVLRTVRSKANREPAETQANVDTENPGDSGKPGDEVDLDTIEIRRFVTEPAKVSYNYGFSRSVHFQTVSIGVTVTIPCYKEEIDEAIDEAKQICIGRLKDANKQATGVLDRLIDDRIKKDQELNGRGVA